MSILVERYVYEGNRSFHAGHAHANNTSVSIENVNSTGEPDWRVSPTTYKGLVALTHTIAKRNGLLPLIPFQNLFPHDYWSATRCPGWLKTQLNNLAKDVNSYKGGTILDICDNLSPFFAAGRPQGILSITIHHGATLNFGSIGATFKTRGVSANYGVSSQITGKSKTPPPKSKPAKKTVQQLANEVMTGQWGNEPQRSQRLRAEGYDAGAVQAAVNARYGIGKPAPTKPSAASVTTVARQVIAGAFGNAPHREANLRRAGHNPTAVQREVNRLLGVGGAPVHSGGIFSVGQNVQVTNPVAYDGARLGVSGTYRVMEVRGDRIVIGRGGQITAAIKNSNLRRV